MIKLLNGQSGEIVKVSRSADRFWLTGGGVLTFTLKLKEVTAYVTSLL